MNFSFLEQWHQSWREVLVIGRTVEWEGQTCYMLGMTLAESAQLHILEPYQEQPRRRTNRTYRRRLKESDGEEVRFFHCSQICLGNTALPIQGGSARPLRASLEDLSALPLFFRMLDAGWIIPDWLKQLDWSSWQLVSLDLPDIQALPHYTPDLPLTLTHRAEPIRHTLEKTVTLTVDKPRTISFTDHLGEEVFCHINRVFLIDMWQVTEEKFRDPAILSRGTPEELERAKKHCLEALEQSCPKGFCQIGIEYECSKDLQLQFYSKEYLKSSPRSHGHSGALILRTKPDQELGTHGLPLKSCVINTPVSPDTIKIPAELFFYYERKDAWEETFV